MSTPQSIISAKLAELGPMMIHQTRLTAEALRKREATPGALDSRNTSRAACANVFHEIQAQLAELVVSGEDLTKKERMTLGHLTDLQLVIEIASRELVAREQQSGHA